MITGKRLLKNMLSWDFEDYRGLGTPKSISRKKWSSKLRSLLKRETRKEIKNIE